MDLRKIAAACLAATMMFGAAPILAADNSSTTGEVDKSPVPEEVQVPEDVMYDYPWAYAPNSGTTEIDGETKYIYSEQLSDEVIKEVDSQEKVEKIIENAGFVVPEGATILVTGADYSVFEHVGMGANTGEKKELEGPVEITLNAFSTYANYMGVPSNLDFKAGQTVYVMHKQANGEWEVIESVVNEKGEIVVTVNGLSPIVIARIMSDGSIVKLEEAEETKAPVKGTTNNNEVKTKKVSPNTGI